MIIWHYIIKRNFLLKCKIFFINVKNGEDEEFGARLLCLSKSISFCSKNIYWHNKRIKGSLRYSRNFKSTESYVKLLIEYLKFISKFNLSNNKMKFLNECIRFAYGELSARIILHNKKEIKKLSFILKVTQNKKNFI